MNCLIVLSLFTEFSFHIYEVSAALAKNTLLLGMFDNTVGEKVMQLRSGEVLGEGGGWEGGGSAKAGHTAHGESTKPGRVVPGKQRRKAI